MKVLGLHFEAKITKESTVHMLIKKANQPLQSLKQLFG